MIYCLRMKLTLVPLAMTLDQRNEGLRIERALKLTRICGRLVGVRGMVGRGKRFARQLSGVHLLKVNTEHKRPIKD